ESFPLEPLIDVFGNLRLKRHRTVDVADFECKFHQLVAIDQISASSAIDINDLLAAYAQCQVGFVKPVRDVPGTNQALDHINDHEQNRADNAEKQDCRKHTNRLEHALRLHYHVSQSLLRGNELARDCPDECKRDGHLHSCEHVRQGAGHANLEKNLQR